MQSLSSFSLLAANGMTLDEAGKAQLHSLAEKYPYFLPLRALCALVDDEANALRQLPHYYGANPVLLHSWAEKLKYGEQPTTAVPEPAATEIPEATPPEQSDPAASKTPTVADTVIVAEHAAPEAPKTESEEVAAEITPEASVAAIELPGTAPDEAEDLPEDTSGIDTDASVAMPEEATESEDSPVPESVETAVPEAATEASSGILPVYNVGTDAPLPEEPEEMIQPLFTRDYFKHQGVSVEGEEGTFEIKKPSGNDLMVMRSFGEWLRFFHSKRVQATEEQEDKKALKAMWQKGKLAAALEEEDEEIPEVVFEMAVKSISHEGNPTTETMAKIYLGQGKWEKAIGVYEQLQLRNPQKSTYFAEKIAAIEQQHRP